MSGPTFASCRNLLAEDLQAYSAEIQRLRKGETKSKRQAKDKDAEIARLSAALAEKSAQLEEERARNGDVKGFLIDWPDEPELGHYFAEAPSNTGRSRALVLRDAAPPLAIIPGAKP